MTEKIDPKDYGNFDKNGNLILPPVSPDQVDSRPIPEGLLSLYEKARIAEESKSLADKLTEWGRSPQSDTAQLAVNISEIIERNMS